MENTKELSIKVAVNNYPDYADSHKFIVATQDDSEYWFWGAYDDEVKAANVAYDIGGVVLPNA